MVSKVHSDRSGQGGDVDNNIGDQYEEYYTL